MIEPEKPISPEVVAVLDSWSSLQKDPDNSAELERLGRALGNVQEVLEIIIAPALKQQKSYEERKLEALLIGMGLGSEVVMRGKPRLAAGPEALGYGSFGKGFVFNKAEVNGAGVESRLYDVTVPFPAVRGVRSALQISPQTR